MSELLFVIPALPFAGFLVLALFGRRFSRKAASFVGVGSVGIAAVLALVLTGSYVSSHAAGGAWKPLTYTAWSWMHVGGFHPTIGFYLDPLSVVMLLVVTCVGFLIHLYSTQYMEDDESYSRFFAEMNLFVCSMLLLVLGDNLLLLYLGWEGVGLCSYLLIGFWYKDPANGRAARKAFLVTRIGDTAMAVGMLLLYTQLGTFHIQALMTRAHAAWPVGGGLAVASAALLFGGAIGKSAQLPLQTWLPDAMAGPTPVSALIHAATMVTAGVYLVARTHVLFALAPVVLTAVAVVGAATLLFAGCAALAQYDIKRVLAYSTISQLGYMFLGLGVGSYAAGIFHLMTHAFFKALLFLGAGAVIHALHGEQDMRKMGALRKKMPVTFWTFLAASAALAGFPLVSAGFYSKDMILWGAWNCPRGGHWLWAAGVVGVLITGIYTFRMVFMTFYGEEKSSPGHLPKLPMKIPLVVLGILSVVGGFVEIPRTLGDFPLFSGFLNGTFHTHAVEGSIGMEGLMQAISAGAALLGIAIAWRLFLRKPRPIEAVLGARLQKFWFTGWAFDALYDALFVKPYIFLARVNKGDFIDSIFHGAAGLVRLMHRGVRLTQGGKVRFYVAGIAFGAVVVVGMVVFL